ncbi:MAG TPA: tRNA preQ1(34) S-adenosylmethionine ribosyltransferase-isomerase QueA, partial [Longimicrobiales bacterium]|nr:tRNA preQ1(34) S-adenosylmethionine ribosyltransferase-isomerase QueA [Longimicrobiales bacterium]
CSWSACAKFGLWSKRDGWSVSRRAEENYPTSAFDYELPRDRIARYPAARRDESRLMVLDRARGTIEHRCFRDLAEYIAPVDVMVLNETKVFPARLLGTREGGGAAEVLLLRPQGEGEGEGEVWEALVKPGARLQAGKSVRIADDFAIDIVEVKDDGTRVVRLSTSIPVADALQRYGHMPLPPYMDREEEAIDRERYQTVYAREQGSVAAPTAGLHFTPELLASIEEKGTSVARITLHVGVGTFRPVEVEDPAEHVMHEEIYFVSAAAAQQINDVRAKGGKVWAVGTTVTRTLESIAEDDGTINAGSGSTAMFIRPGYEFKCVDRLITNFHLPRSTLMMLVAAFAGYDLTMKAYRIAVDEGYRFYSYGDCMVVI